MDGDVERELERLEAKMDAEIKRIDDGQAHILARLSTQDATLTRIDNSQTEQTVLLHTISDYFAFGRVGRKLLIAVAAVATFVATIILAVKEYLKP